MDQKFRRKLHLARFSRYRHFCVLQFLQKIRNGRHFWRDNFFFENWVNYSAEIPYVGGKSFGFVGIDIECKNISISGDIGGFILSTK